MAGQEVVCSSFPIAGCPFAATAAMKTATGEKIGFWEGESMASNSKSLVGFFPHLRAVQAAVRDKDSLSTRYHGDTSISWRRQEGSLEGRSCLFLIRQRNLKGQQQYFNRNGDSSSILHSRA
jgi:hypothetical protein